MKQDYLCNGVYDDYLLKCPIQWKKMSDSRICRPELAMCKERWMELGSGQNWFNPFGMDAISKKTCEIIRSGRKFKRIPLPKKLPQMGIKSAAS